MLLVSGATATLRRIRDPHLGRLLRPGNGNRPDDLPWAADNGAFSGFDPRAFAALLDAIAGHPGCLWAAAPDVVASSDGTDALFAEWEPRIHALGLPVAYVGQDGLRSPPWESLECLFIGGSTEWKLGRTAEVLSREARRRGKLVHVGRVNTRRRFRAAMIIGADSVDGTAFSRFPDTQIPRALAWLREMEPQCILPYVEQRKEAE